MQTIRQYALKLLSIRDYSKQELIKKLTMKGFLAKDIDLLLDDFCHLSWIDDDRYAEALLNVKSKKGYGPYYIRQLLQHKGISEERIAHLINMKDNCWKLALKQVWQKRFKGIYPKDFQTRAKQIRFLTNRGFSSEQIEHLYTFVE